MSTRWRDRITFSENRQKLWAKKYKIEELELLYEGFHYKEQLTNDATEVPPIANFFYATIETKMPNLVIDAPRFAVTPRPKTVNTDPDGAFKYAQALEDVINDWAADSQNLFAGEMEQAIFDAWFGFGVVEVGYSATWLENPRGQKPEIAKPEGDESYEKPGKKYVLPDKEQLFVRRIPFERFLVSGGDNTHLVTQDWVGYWEFVHVSDLFKSPSLRNRDELKRLVNQRKQEYSSQTTILSSTPEKDGGSYYDDGSYVKLYKIWDIRARRKRYYCFDLAEDKCLLFDKEYDFFPFFDLRLKKPRKGFLPLPVTFNWISPQTQANDVRKDMEVHRKRFRRVYLAVAGRISEDEIDKLRVAEDGSVLTAQSENAVQPLQTMAINPSSDVALQVSKSDFDIISGTTAEQRGESSGRVTATQASISDRRAGIRETREKAVIGDFYRKVGSGLIRLAQLSLVNPISVAVPNARDEGIMDEVEPGYKTRSIDPSVDFGPEDLEYEVDLRILDSSPFPDDVERTAFLNFLSLITQFNQLAFSPTIVREMAARSGYKNERVIKAVQQMAMLSVLGQIETGQQQNSNLAQTTAEGQLPPDQEQVANQLNAQGIPITEDSSNG